MYEAEKIIRNVIEEIIAHHKKAIFVGDDEMQITYVRNMAMDYADIYFLCYKKYDTVLHQLEKIHWEEYEEIYLISFYGAEYVERFFRLHNISYEWIYDVFEREGLFLQKEFFTFGKENMLTLLDPKKEQILSSTYRGAVQCELYCQQSKYHSACNYQTKRIALEKCLFLALYMKNFIAVKEYVTLLKKDEKMYEQVWNEIKDLLRKIKKSIGNRKQDIIWYWLDAIPYGDEYDMPYLQSAMRKSVVFENAFTNIAYTSPTLRVMFLGKKDIDDGGYCIDNITEENSPILRFLKEQGYDIKVVSGHFGAKFKGGSVKTTADWLLPASAQYWDMISGMLLQERKTLWIVHTIDAHVPYLSRWICDDNYMNRNERYRLSKQALDEQLAFYDQMIGNETARIYMSDHGREGIDKHHALFSIYHNHLKPRRIEGLFSYLDFGSLLKEFIMNGDINEKEFERDYVEIGNLDYYNHGNIEKIFRSKDALRPDFFGYKGIIDKEYIYIHYATGKEYLHKRDELFLFKPLLYYDCEEDICTPELLPKYRKLAGEYPKEMIKDEKFKYTKFMYSLYHNIMRHNNISKRMDMINQLLENYPDDSVGIRTGGVASATLYYILSKENRKKIWGFIDNNKECFCSRLCLPIICYDQMEELKDIGVQAVIIPSYTYLKMLRDESKSWPERIKIIDIYDWFDRNGIECRENFYELKGTDEDYNVGFSVNS